MTQIRNGHKIALCYRRWSAFTKSEAYESAAQQIGELRSASMAAVAKAQKKAAGETAAVAQRLTELEAVAKAQELERQLATDARRARLVANTIRRMLLRVVAAAFAGWTAAANGGRQLRWQLAQFAMRRDRR
eukprot:SAG31_NODE_6811_length_1880_cov_1.650197_1_plen_131_part_10